MEFRILWVDAFRLFLVADKLINNGGHLSEFDKTTYKRMFEQLDEHQKEYVVGKFGDNLNFLIDKTSI